VNGREAARSGEWAQHFSNASCFPFKLDKTLHATLYLPYRKHSACKRLSFRPTGYNIHTNNLRIRKLLSIRKPQNFIEFRGVCCGMPIWRQVVDVVVRVARHRVRLLIARLNELCLLLAITNSARPSISVVAICMCSSFHSAQCMHGWLPTAVSLYHSMNSVLGSNEAFSFRPIY